MTKDNPLTIKIDNEEVRLWVEGTTFHRSAFKGFGHYERECLTTEDALSLCEASYSRGIELIRDTPK